MNSPNFKGTSHKTERQELIEYISKQLQLVRSCIATHPEVLKDLQYFIPQIEKLKTEIEKK